MHNESYLTQALYQVLGAYNKTTSVFESPEGLLDNVCFKQGGIGAVGNPGPQGAKGFQVSYLKSTLIIFFFFFNLAGSSLLVYVCLCDTLQGIKGALGDPGLPGPTGIRGEFGERVSLTRVPPY